MPVARGRLKQGSIRVDARRAAGVEALPYRDQPPPPLPAPPPLPPIERDPREGWPALPPAAELDEPRPPVLFVIGMPVRLADFI